MTELLDTAITLRTLLYCFVAALPVLYIVARLLYLAGRNQPRYNLRNPAYGAPPSGIKWQDGKPYVTK